jgi:hypothetical protein
MTDKIFVIDPGTKTGVAWGSAGQVGTVASRIAAGSVESRTIEGGFIQQTAQLTGLFDVYMRKAEKVHVVVEDFILRKMTSGRELLDPVRVASGFLAVLYDSFAPGFDVTWQQPSAAMTYATNNRLREWGLWIRGSDPALEHQRDARRHFCLYVADRARAEQRARQNP